MNMVRLKANRMRSYVSIIILPDKRIPTAYEFIYKRYQHSYFCAITGKCVSASKLLGDINKIAGEFAVITIRVDNNMYTHEFKQPIEAYSMQDFVNQLRGYPPTRIFLIKK